LCVIAAPTGRVSVVGIRHNNSLGLVSATSQEYACHLPGCALQFGLIQV